MLGRRIRFTVLALVFAVAGVLLTPSAAWAARTIKATNSAACSSSQRVIAVTYIMTNIDNPPNITVYLVGSSISIAPDVYAAPIGNIHYYSADVTAPVDRNRPATASVPNDWNGKFEFNSVTCQNVVSTPSPIATNGTTASADVGHAEAIAPPSRSPSTPASPSASATHSASDESSTDITPSSGNITAPFVANRPTPKRGNGLSFMSIVIMLCGATMVIGPAVLLIIMWRKRNQDDNDD